MSEKEVEAVSKPELKVEQVGESKNTTEGSSNQQESKANDTSVEAAEKNSVEADANPETLKSPASVDVPRKIEEDVERSDNTDAHDKDREDEGEAPPLPTRRRPIETSAEGSSKALPKKKENQILKQLKEAFPNIEENYIKAVIIASQGALEPAFHALLFLSDPESGKDIDLPSEPLEVPPREPVQQGGPSQLEQDEMLARQLDQKYNRRRSKKNGVPEGYDDRQRVRDHRRRIQTPMNPEEYRDIYGDQEEEDMWGQLVEKDLPDLRNRANKSIQDTATKLNGWFNGISKKWSGDEDRTNSRGRLGDTLREEPQRKPERRRFNSFGAQIDDDSTLKSHGISLQNEEDDLDVPPQLKNRTQAENDLVTRTAYIDTPPENTQRRKWQPVPPAPMTNSPTRHGRSPDEDDFLLNSEDEL